MRRTRGGGFAAARGKEKGATGRARIRPPWLARDAWTDGYASAGRPAWRSASQVHAAAAKSTAANASSIGET